MDFPKAMVTVIQNIRIVLINLQIILQKLSTIMGELLKVHSNFMLAKN
jgi:hypothetical protein